ncbi:transposase, partial [Faecalicatena contorta]
MARRKRDPKKDALVQAILNQYQPENVGDMQDALKDIFGPMFESMLQGEMKDHLGYESNDRQEKEGTNRRNGYSA